MSELYNLIENLCKEKGTNITAMCKAANISRAPLTELKMGRSKTLSSATLSKIAAYFGVSVDYLLGNEEKPLVQEVQGVDVKDALQQLEEILSADTALFDGTCLTEEDRLKAYGGIQFLKAQLAARAKNDKNKGNG